MSVREIQLRNFRGFRNVKLKLKPLTVLLGPNSSGKSSFGHALAAAAHCQKLFRGTSRASLTPNNDSDEWPIDLGTLADLRTRGQSGRVYVGIEVENGRLELGFGECGESESEKNNLFLSYLSHPFNADVTELLPVDSSEQSPLTAPGLVRLSQSSWWDEIAKQHATVDLDGLFMQSALHLAGRTSIPPAGAQERLRFLLSTLTYLRATRRRPLRAYDKRPGKWQMIGYAGEWTAGVLAQRGGEQISFPSPPPIPSSLAEAGSHLDEAWRIWEGDLLTGVSTWLQQVELASSVAAVETPEDQSRVRLSITLRGQEPHDITEIGFGLSQVLPVVVAGLLQPKGSLFVVDLPEAHLHPWPQARIADFFCSLALSGRHAIVETHSEMFFHRLRLWAAMNKELLDLIAVYFIDEPQHGECRQPREIGLASGQQIRWPVGFLGEAWDTEKRIQILREARSVRA